MLYGLARSRGPVPWFCLSKITAKVAARVPQGGEVSIKLCPRHPASSQSLRKAMAHDLMGDMSPMAMCSLGYARSGTRGKHTRQILLCHSDQVSISAELMTKRRRKGGGVFIISAVSKRTKEKKEEVRECAWCMLDQSHLKTL